MAAALALASTCPAQLLPTQALTVDRDTFHLYRVDQTGAVLAAQPLSSTVGVTGQDVVVTPNGATAIVSLLNPMRLDFWDLTTTPMTLLGSLAMPFTAQDLDIGCTSSGFALVTDTGDNRVVSVHVASRTIVQSLVMPFGVHAVDLNHDGTLALVVARNNNLVRVLQVDPVTGALTDTGVNVPRGGSSTPNNVCIAPNGRLAMVTNNLTQTVDVLAVNGAAVTYVNSIALGAGNQSVAFTPNGQAAYVWQPFVGQVAKLAIDPLGNVTDTGVRFPGLGTMDTALFGVDQVTVSPTGRLYVRTRTAFHVIDTATDTLVASTALGIRGSGITTLCRHNHAPACDADLAAARADFLEPSPGAFVVTEGSTITVPIAVVDPDGDAVSVVLSGPAGATIGPVTSGASPFAAQIAWTPTAADKAGGPHLFTVTASDPDGAVASCSFTVVDVNLRPVASAGGDANGEIVVACTGPAGAFVQLNGAAVDADDAATALSYHWDLSDLMVALNNPGIANPGGVFPHGVTMATLTVTDGRGGVATSDVRVVVVDTVPPQVECTTDKAVLWPPQHGMQEVEVIIRATDLCTNPAAIVIVAATLRSDEADDASGGGDGATTGDVNGADGFANVVDITAMLTFDALADEFRATVLLRAERHGAGDGRKYTIDVIAVDGANNPATASCCVVVPHDRRS